MFRNIVWCGGVLAALLATLPPAEAGVPSAVADFVDAALAGFDWMTPILAAIGTALGWLLVARGPFV